ncbi:MAG: SgcJ/EcaC family oxidoreductase, partial [Gemmatimonadetes bacterium]|nr:SgcJ/EcaC family oxidoreductase [Gemmatimonadota bacterium]
MSRWTSAALPCLAVAAVVAAAAAPSRAAAQALPHVAGAGPEKPAVWREVGAMLEHGAAAWNGGDLDGFISDYTDDATFVTSRGLVRGASEIRSRYAARFGPGATRDSLTFRLLDVDVLGPRTAAMVATWTLSRGDSVTSSGPPSQV